MYRHPHSRARQRAPIALAVAAALALAGAAAATAATTNTNPGSLELSNAKLSKRAATEGMVLLENRNATLPIAHSGNVAIFGVGAYKTVKGGTGSGDVNNRYLVTARQGLENAGYNVTTSNTYYQAMVSAYDTEYGSSAGSFFGPAVDYSSVEQALTSTSVQPTAPTDTAIYMIARNSGEGADRSSGKGDYQLADVERANIELIGKTYKKVIVVLNVGGIVDTSFYSAINAAETDPAGGTAIDSMLLMSQAGQESGNALVEVLNGTVNPSGKLTDTWASKYSYYPASATFGNNDSDPLSEDYSEGIYVGYRYFDSFAKSIDPANTNAVVDYPFGYGLSYTDFQIDTQSVTADINTVTVKARVTNVGTSATGKEVVEVYASAPQTGLDKPYQQLAGYAKTDALAPGDSQVVTITFDTTSLASYDTAKSANVLDAGDYAIRVGNSSRNTHVAAKLNIAQTTTVEQLSTQLNDETPATELTSDPTKFYSYATEAAELAAAPRINVSTVGFVAPNNASALAQTVFVDSSSPYYAIDGNKISTTTAYVPQSQTDWEGTGSPYVAKTGETVQSIATDPTTTLYDVAAGRASMNKFVAGLSVTQLANIVEGASATGSTLSASGAAGYTTAKYESLGIPAMTLSDGPAGLRITKDIASTPATHQYGTAWPIGTMLAQTWDRDLVQQVGAAIGAEMQEYGVTLWLAPGMNIHRDPLNGRNFEYYSEDPLLSGLTSAATTKGVQSVPGVGVTIKHFLANNQETQRNATNAVISERALREIYLKGFEISVKSAQPMAVMTSYNQVNGSFSVANYDSVTDVLRGEWGFKGTVMSDWGGVDQGGIVGSMYSGNDLIESGGNPEAVINSIKKVDPQVDISGLPVYVKSSQTFGTFVWTSYQWKLGGLSLSATGDQTISTTVNASTDLSAQPQSGETVRDAINNETFVPNAKFTSVDNVYQAVQAFLASSNSALSATQKAAITLTGVVHQTAGDTSTPVTSYTLTLKGSYPAVGYTMRLGDLQRSASRILNTAMQSAQFAELAKNQGVTGVTAVPYSEQFTDLHNYLTSSSGKVVAAQTGQGPALSLATESSTPASGWFTGPVKVKVTTDSDAQAYVDVDSGELRTYSEPVTVSGTGTHIVRALAMDADGQYSKILTLAVKIDGVAPVVSATGKNGTLSVKATDANSGIKAIQYSTNGGKTWTTYTKAVTFKKATTVSYRATDKAGNTSVAKSVSVKLGVIKTAKKSKITGKTKVGATLKVAKGTYKPKSVKVTYKWLRNGKAIVGATQSKYTATKKDQGKKLSVRLKVTKAGYKTLTLTKKTGTIQR